MHNNDKINEPDSTAVRTALWRALHLQADAEPFVIVDDIGRQLADPAEGWQERPDMKYTRRLRASILARARFIEDTVVEAVERGVDQYVILGAGLDTFAQRRGDAAPNLHIYEIDRGDTLKWKRRRLNETGFGVAEDLHFVEVDFETMSWSDELKKAGFDFVKPAVIACTGVTLYLTKETIAATLKEIAGFAAGTTLAMTLYLPKDLMDEEDRAMQEIAENGARLAGTPFESFFTRDEMLKLAADAGFHEAKTVSTQELGYFEDRTDGLQPASGEVFLVAEV
jgi:methyltransferase (TIGR00027 family)